MSSEERFGFIVYIVLWFMVIVMYILIYFWVVLSVNSIAQMLVSIPAIALSVYMTHYTYKNKYVFIEDKKNE